jgi:hypothetical protein
MAGFVLKPYSETPPPLARLRIEKVRGGVPLPLVGQHRRQPFGYVWSNHPDLEPDDSFVLDLRDRCTSTPRVRVPGGEVRFRSRGEIS